MSFEVAALIVNFCNVLAFSGFVNPAVCVTPSSRMPLN